MVNERLLSEQEISKALTVSAEFASENAWSFGPLTVAQDAKTTAALIAWLEANLFHETDHGLEFHCLSKFAQQDWQEFKLSLQSSINQSLGVKK